MTRPKRLALLEARRRQVEGGGFFDADLDAGVWREVNTGRTLPMTPDEAQEAQGSGGGVLMLSPPPDRSKKLIYGIRAADL